MPLTNKTSASLALAVSLGASLIATAAPAGPLSSGLDNTAKLLKTDNPPVLKVMASPPPRREVRIDSAPGAPSRLRRYIVTHRCTNQSPEEITSPLAGESYSIDSKMQFTPQFVISASDAAIAKLRNQPCVTQIQADGLAAPAR